VFGRRGFNRRRAKIIDGYGLSPPASTGISPCESIRSDEKREIRLCGFQKPPVPNPRRRVLRVWEAWFQPPARKKSAMDRDCRPPPVPTYPPANQFAAIKCAKSASADFKNHPSPTREGGFCVFGRRGFNRRRAKNQRGRGIVAPRQADPPAIQFAAMKSAKPASEDFKNHPSPTREGGFCVFGRRGFNPRRAKIIDGYGLLPPARHIPRRINSRLSNARNPPPRISETHPSPTREGGFCVFGRRGFNRRRAKNHLPNPRRRDLRVWQARFQPPARKNHRWIWIAAPPAYSRTIAKNRALFPRKGKRP